MVATPHKLLKTIHNLGSYLTGQCRKRTKRVNCLTRQKYIFCKIYQYICIKQREKRQKEREKCRKYSIFGVFKVFLLITLCAGVVVAVWIVYFCTCNPLGDVRGDGRGLRGEFLLLV